MIRCYHSDQRELGQKRCYFVMLLQLARYTVNSPLLLSLQNPSLCWSNPFFCCIHPPHLKGRSTSISSDIKLIRGVEQVGHCWCQQHASVAQAKKRNKWKDKIANRAELTCRTKKPSHLSGSRPALLQMSSCLCGGRKPSLCRRNPPGQSKMAV